VDSPSALRSARLPNASGLHARPCHALVIAALKFEAELVVRCRDQAVNGKSILELMTLNAPFGETLEFQARGRDAEALVAHLAALVEAGFGERD
jgi:phosphotransferase system HPr (HPr) family protein